jgi:polyferredoxin
LEGGVPIALANAGIRAGLGWLFVWKMSVLLSVLLLSVKIFRPFCRFLCPLGAVYSLFNRVSVLRIHVDEAKCDGCGVCHAVCKIEAPGPEDPECIRCGVCVSNCPSRALRWTGSTRRAAGNAARGA